MSGRRRLLSIATLFPNAGAPQFGTFVARSLEALAATGEWEVTVINPIGLPPVRLGRYARLADAAADGVENGVAVHRPAFTLVPRIGGRLNPRLIARAVLPLARRLHRAAPFDLVDAQFFYPDGPAAARIAGALDLKLAIKARGADIHYWSGKEYARRAMLQAAEQAALLLAVSEALAGDMAALGMARDKLTVHYTGLDRDRFRPLDHPEIRARLGRELGIALPHRQPLLACVGALIARKGQEFAIRALLSLAGAHLLLVGIGEDEARLRALAGELGLGERVHFLGSVDHDLLPVLLSACDAMVLPSASEGLANAWVEALACGTPIVIADAGGARELVTSDIAGRIVPRDPGAIAGAVRDLLADPPPREAVAATVAHLSWSEHAKRMSAAYQALLAQG